MRYVKRTDIHVNEEVEKETFYRDGEVATASQSTWVASIDGSTFGSSREESISMTREGATFIAAISELKEALNREGIEVR